MKPSTSPATDHEREKNQMFRALSEQRRRSTLRILQRHRKANLSGIAKEIARMESDGSSSDVPSDAVTAVRIDLYHRHLPILAEAGLVQYMEGRNVLALSEYGTNVTAYLEESPL